MADVTVELFIGSVIWGMSFLQKRHTSFLFCWLSFRTVLAILLFIRISSPHHLSHFQSIRLLGLQLKIQCYRIFLLIKSKAHIVFCAWWDWILGHLAHIELWSHH
jgi:hypothetical protein